jgi:nicotinate-nucleotide pyrophosphorylase (carboxylating)
MADEDSNAPLSPILKDVLDAARPLIELAIAEDIGNGDATSLATMAPQIQLRGLIIAKQAGIVAGLPVARTAYERLSRDLRFVAHKHDGEAVYEGELIAEIHGPGQEMLAGERLVLNFLQHLSGVATLAGAFVAAVADTGAIILDTRKTLPGYRILEKYAVRCGGGHNHRMALDEMLLIKENHIVAAGSISEAVARARRTFPRLGCEVEVKNLSELEEALGLNVDRIMLDNMNLDETRTAVRVTRRRIPLEASGGVSLEHVAAIAQTGVDYISVGAITHSAPALDISMLVHDGEQTNDD